MKKKRRLRVIAVIMALFMLFSNETISIGIEIVDYNEDDIVTSDGKCSDSLMKSESDSIIHENEETIALLEQNKSFSSYKDMNNHWARQVMEKAFNDGIINGFSDNTMRPNDVITGAQMIAIITRMLNASQTVDISGLNVPSDAWYKTELSRGIALGIVKTSQAATINEKMTRKDAFVMISDAFQIQNADPDLSTAVGYSDFSSLGFEDKLVIASLINNKYVQGYNGSLGLSSSITRAEFITVIYRLCGQFVNSDKSQDYSKLSGGTIISGNSFNLTNSLLNHNIWLDTKIRNINVTNSTMQKLIVRSDSISSFNVSGSTINRLVIAAREGYIDLNCSGIRSTVIGDGSGTINLKPEGNHVDVIGNGRNVNITSNAGTIAISGNYCTVNIAAGISVNKIVINGKGNSISVNSSINNMVVSGTNNNIYGSGSITSLIVENYTNNISIPASNTISRVDKGISGMTASISAPSTINAGSYLKAKLVLKNINEGKNVKVIWYLDDKEASVSNIKLSNSSIPEFDYYVNYSENVASSYKISCKIQHTGVDGQVQTISASAVTVNVNKPLPEILSKVSTYYSGNYTKKWALEHNYTNDEKVKFVNAMGYSSITKYLIWVNIGTQRCSVFSGSYGNWKLLRSTLVSTGANDSTPRGVYKTTYKQTHWTTEEYTVRPVVRFYTEGYAFHSRLYYPDTVTLKTVGNDVGYPLSHGCVRMEAEDIQWIYDNIPNGTTVVVY